MKVYQLLIVSEHTTKFWSKNDYYIISEINWNLYLDFINLSYFNFFQLLVTVSINMYCLFVVLLLMDLGSYKSDFKRWHCPLLAQLSL